MKKRRRARGCGAAGRGTGRWARAAAGTLGPGHGLGEGAGRQPRPARRRTASARRAADRHTRGEEPAAPGPPPPTLEPAHLVPSPPHPREPAPAGRPEEQTAVAPRTRGLPAAGPAPGTHPTAPFPPRKACLRWAFDVSRGGWGSAVHPPLSTPTRGRTTSLGLLPAEREEWSRPALGEAGLGGRDVEDGVTVSRRVLSTPPRPLPADPGER